MLVAGQELDWLETGDTEAGAGANLVSLPGARAGGECVGMFGDIVGTVNKCRVGISMQLVNIDVHFSVHVWSVPSRQYALPVVLSPPHPRPDLAQQPQEPRQEGGQAPAHAEEVNL